MQPRGDCSAAPVGNSMNDSQHYYHYQRSALEYVTPMVEVAEVVVVAAEAMPVGVVYSQYTLVSQFLAISLFCNVVAAECISPERVRVNDLPERVRGEGFAREFVGKWTLPPTAPTW